MQTKHLAEAKRYLGIAEAADSKKAAFKAATKEIAAHRDETGDSIATIAEALGRKPETIRLLLKWQKTGFKADTPWLMDTKATSRAERSHARKILREATADDFESMVAELPLERVNELLGVLGNVQLQLHPATSVKGSAGSGSKNEKATFGFPFEIGRSHVTLTRAIEQYVDKWDEVAPTATEEELQAERDLIAPSLQRLRMTIEEVVFSA